MKIMAIVDRHGLPLSVSTHAANHREVRLVQLCFDFYMIEAKPENLIGDRAYDSDPPKGRHRDDRAASVQPKQAAHARSSSASSPGFNGSAGSSFAGSTTANNFLGFVQLACLVILFKRF
jgi:hypothetical protein